MVGTLYIVATPIGNLQDITLRALEALKNADIIACEDTRVTGVLLKHFEIKKPLFSYFQHSSLSKIDYIIEQLKDGKNIALVTDAGTPGISDPGQELIAHIRGYEVGQKVEQFQKNIVIPAKAGIQEWNNLDSSSQATAWNDRTGQIQIIPIPGPSALATAASVSGMIEKEFYFAGFLPKKKGRQTQFLKLSKLDVPIIIYESAMRLERTLEDIKTYLGESTEVFIAREMTKMFEEYWGGNIEEVIADLKNHQMKGEIVLIVQNKG